MNDEDYIRNQKKWQHLSETNSSSIMIDKNKIFCSTVLNDSNESIELHLSETCLEDTKINSKAQTQKPPITIVISDSSDDDCINETIDHNLKNKRRFENLNNKVTLSKNLVKQFTNLGIDGCNSKVYVNDPSKLMEKRVDPRSEFESEEEKVSELIRVTTADCITLSERKKTDILRWLFTNIEQPSLIDVDSQSIISDSRKSTSFSSGNSSLERLELVFETPNNRGKISHPSTAKSIFTKTRLHFDTPVIGTTNDDDSTPLNSRVVNIDNVSTPVNLRLADVKNDIPEKSIILIAESSDEEEVISSGDELKKTSEGGSKKILLIAESSDEDNEEVIISSEDEIKRSPEVVGKKTPLLQRKDDIRDKKTPLSSCTDILEKLYGKNWKNRAKDLLHSEPKKERIKIIAKGTQSEKKVIPDRKKVSRIPVSSRNKNHPKQKLTADSFIKNSTSTESSPDCTYYTAVSNVKLPKNDQTEKKCKKPEVAQRLFKFCDPESSPLRDLKDDKWKKTQVGQKNLAFTSDSSSSTTSEFDPDDIVFPKTKKILKKPQSSVRESNKKVSKERSFLTSLSASVPENLADKTALMYRNQYKTKKEDLCKYLFDLYNENVFEGKLPSNMTIEWSARMRNTAGYCYNKKSIKALGTIIRSSRIVLATKILDNPERLRDTLLHEMCHAATWLVNNVSDGHGPFWKSWAQRAMRAFPELPPIKRCHDYDINTKYTYKCMSCGYSIGRHSKSLDTTRKRCGYCRGTFELLINKTTKSGKVQVKSTSKSKEPSGFALFVKENYQNVKQAASGAKHAEIMKILGQQFSAVKITPLKAKEN